MGKGFGIILFGFLAQASAQVSGYTGNSKDIFVDSLFERAVKASPNLDLDDLDGTTLGKAATLAIPSGNPRTVVSSNAFSSPQAQQLRGALGRSTRSLPFLKPVHNGKTYPALGSLHDELFTGVCKRFPERTVVKASATPGVVPEKKYRIAVIGGGPAGASAAEVFADEPNVETVLFERKMDNCKPCGGAIPLCMVEEFDLPLDIIDRKVRKMTMVSPTNREIDIGKTLKPDEWIGMTRREILDKYLRDRAVAKGAQSINALVMKVDLPDTPTSPYTIHYNEGGEKKSMQVDVIIGADGANSKVAKAIDAGDFNYAIAFQERIKISDELMKRYEEMAEMYVGDDVSPDFYGWVFPKYDHVGVGTGTVVNRPAIKEYQDAMRARAGDKIKDGKIIRVEAHPIPEHYRPRRVVGRVALVGDAAGYVTKCSGEGIYFAAKSGRMAAEAIVQMMQGGSRLPTEGEIKKTYLRDYDRAYFPTYTVLDLLQKVFYSDNAGREAFVELCDSEYVQKVTFDSYLYKKVQGGNPIEDVKLLFDTLGSLIKYKWLQPAKADKPFSNPVESLNRLGSGTPTR